MAKWWELFKALLKTWWDFEESQKAEKDQATAQAQAHLQDWGDQLEQEVKDDEKKAHQEIEDTKDLDGGRAAALAHIERLRNNPGK